MAIVRMRRLSLMIYNSIRDDFFARLQKLGVLHLEQATLPEGGASSLNPVEISSESVELYLSDLTEVMAFLDSRVPPVKMGLVESMAASRPGVDYDRLRAVYNETRVRDAINDVKTLERDYRHALNQLQVLEKEKAEIELWKGTPLDLDILNGASSLLEGVTGSIPAESAGLLAEKLSASTPLADAHMCRSDVKETFFFIVYHASEKAAVQNCLRELGFVESFVTNRRGTPDKALAMVDADINTARARLSEIEAKVDKALSLRETFRIITDYLLVRRDRLEALKKGGDTGTVSVYTGYFPSRREKEFVEFLKNYPEIDYTVSDPSDEENVPIDLREAPPASPFEVVTRLYGLPVYGKTIDPTPHITPFYFVFFGICLSDFVYGLVMFLLFGYLAIRARRNPGTSRFMGFLSVVGVSTMIFGVVFGSYMGDLFTVYINIPVIRDFISRTVLIDPLKSPMVVMYYALLLGAIQLLYGLVLRMVNALKENILESLFENIPWLVFLTGFFGMLVLVGLPGLAPGLPVLPAVFGSVFMYALGGGAGLILLNGIRKEKNKVAGFFGGLYSLYGSTSWMGDLLSYARLLALGVGTGVISSVFNFIAFMLIGGAKFDSALSVLASIPSLAFGIVIIAIGHVFNLVMSAFGAFIHSARLQYVEFFSKFYASGGSEYKPLARQGQYHDIKREKA